jgi:hypothetical protein
MESMGKMADEPKGRARIWLDVHDPVLRFASAALPPGHPVYVIIVAAIIEIALLNCTHVIAAYTPPPPTNTSWRPSQRIGSFAPDGRQAVEFPLGFF